MCLLAPAHLASYSPYSCSFIAGVSEDETWALPRNPTVSGKIILDF